MIIFFNKLRTSLRGFILKGLKCNKLRDESERKRFLRGDFKRRVAQWEDATWRSYPLLFLHSHSATSPSLSLLFLSSSRAISSLLLLHAITCKSNKEEKKYWQPPPPSLFLSATQPHHHPHSSSFFFFFLSIVALPLARLTATARAPRRGEESPPSSRRGRWPRKDTGIKVRAHRRAD